MPARSGAVVEGKDRMTLVEVVTKVLENRKTGPNTSENWYAHFKRGRGYKWYLNAWNDVVAVDRPGNYPALSADDLLASNWEFV